MKQRYFFFLLLCSVKLAAQTPIEVSYLNTAYPVFAGVNFESPGDSAYVQRDTGAVPYQLWQIGHPQKTTFTAALNGQRALVTDTLNSYPVNSHVSCTFKVINYIVCGETEIDFNYRINTTAGQDGGMIEISHDNGNSWFNLLNDPHLASGAPYTLSDTVAALGQPGLNGDSSGRAYLRFSAVNYNADVILMRLTFASDNTAEALDGWMIDSIAVVALCLGVPEHATTLPLELGPNPTSGKIFLRSSVAEKFDVDVRDNSGRLIVQKISAGELDLSDLPSGYYFLQVRSGDRLTRKKLVLAH